MKSTRIYASGCEVTSNNEWKQSGQGRFFKTVTLKITDSAKGEAKLTVMRRTDKESFFKQEFFKTYIMP